MPEYTVYLYRSGRVWVHRDAPHKPTDPDPPLLMTTVDAPTQVAALGKLLLQYVDAAAQPYQHIPICIEWFCTLPCDVCAKPLSEHTPTPTPMSTDHRFAHTEWT